MKYVVLCRLKKKRENETKAATHGMLAGLGGNPGAKSGPIFVPPIFFTLAALSLACQSQNTLSSQVWCK
jgi:hypothetical protein